MQEPECNLTLDQLLDELSDVLEIERVAVIRMDTEEIEHTSAAKQRLNQALESRNQDLTPAHEQRLRTIRSNQQHNLILLAHARDLLQNALGIQDARLPRIGRPSRPIVEGSHLDLRG